LEDKVTEDLEPIRSIAERTFPEWVEELRKDKEA